MRSSLEPSGAGRHGLAVLPPNGVAPDNIAEAQDPGARTVSADHTTRKFIRGSSLLLVGRFIAILLNFAVQVLTVRYLTKSDYGAFAYAMGLVSTGSSMVLLGLGKALPRFVPIYQEHGDYARAFGTIALATATVWGLGLSLILLLFGLRDVISDRLVSDPQAVSLLLILVALCPLGAFGTLLQHTVAIFAKPRALFFRRYVLGPGLKLAVVLLVIAISGNVQMLAYGYVFGGIVGAWLYIAILLREWRKQDLLRHIRLRQLKLPARELFGFSLPLLSSEFAVLARGPLAIILLEHFHSTIAVAEYRAVLPVAGLNMTVFEAFGFLFMPFASRLFARGNEAGINDLYWNTAIWITVLTFPVFALTCALAEPLTVLLFGADYAGAGAVLAVLALGYYFNAALGFNSATLRVYGRVRQIVAIDFGSAVGFLILCLLLIPRFGALGAATATTAAFLVQNLLYHAALWLTGTGVALLDSRFLRVYGIASLLMAGLLVFQWLLAPHILVAVALAGLISVVLMAVTRRMIRLEATFPELLRIPLVGRFFT